MRSPKNVCKEHNLYSYQAQKGAEIMAKAIADDILLILKTASVRPLYERVAEYILTAATPDQISGTTKPKEGFQK